MRPHPKAVVSGYSNFPCFPPFPVLPPSPPGGEGGRRRGWAAARLPSLRGPSLSLRRPELGCPEALAMPECSNTSTVEQSSILAHKICQFTGGPFLLGQVAPSHAQLLARESLKAVGDSTLSPSSRNPIRAHTDLSAVRPGRLLSPAAPAPAQASSSTSHMN